MNYYYFININERDEFNADVRNENDETIFEISSPDHLNELVEDGFLSHCHDIKSIKSYLINLGLIAKTDSLFRGNEQRLFY